MNSQKAERALDWRGRLPLLTALEWTSGWFRRYLAGESARSLCLSQIEDYAILRSGMQQSASTD